MAKPEQFTPDQMIEALTTTRGMYTLAAKQLKCSPTTVKRYINKYASVRQALHDLNNLTGDEVELVLYDEAVKKRNPTLLMFLAKTKFKDRGYTERMEHVIFSAEQMKRFEDIAAQGGQSASDLFEGMLNALASELEAGSAAGVGEDAE